MLAVIAAIVFLRFLGWPPGAQRGPGGVIVRIEKKGL
jgi:hypothetical protein